MAEVGDWFKSLPVFTRYWFLGTVLFVLIGRFEIVSRSYLYLSYEPFIHNFEIWRALTSVLYYPPVFDVLINLYFLYSYSTRLERIQFDGKPADYCYLLLFNWVVCIIGGLFLDLPILMDAMLISVIYVWCQLNKDAIVNFWFGVQFKAMYLPWVLFFLRLILNRGGLQELIGILSGHLYFFLKFKYPQEFGGPNLLSTPSILEYYFPPRNDNVRGFGTTPAQSTGNIPRGHSWGHGQVLGR